MHEQRLLVHGQTMALQQLNLQKQPQRHDLVHAAMHKKHLTLVATPGTPPGPGARASACTSTALQHLPTALQPAYGSGWGKVAGEKVPQLASRVCCCRSGASPGSKTHCGCVEVALPTHDAMARMEVVKDDNYTLSCTLPIKVKCAVEGVPKDFMLCLRGLSGKCTQQRDREPTG